MNCNILELVNQGFHEEEQFLVLNELMSITTQHVMADSEYNLEQTRISILKLAKGDLTKVIHFTQAAKFDFRDVILWATEI